MSNFYVGQRVRITGVARSFNVRLIGLEGTVIGFREIRGSTSVELHIDGLGEFRDYDHRRWAFAPENLQPIQPPKSQIDEILAMKDLPDFEIARAAA